MALTPAALPLRREKSAPQRPMRASYAILYLCEQKFCFEEMICFSVLRLSKHAIYNTKWQAMLKHAVCTLF
jgi:hypothetical protein